MHVRLPLLLLVWLQEMNDDIRQQQMQEMMYMSSDGSTRGRGGFRGGRGGPSPRYVSWMFLLFIFDYLN